MGRVLEFHSQAQAKDIHGSSSTVAGTIGGWSHYIGSQEAGRDEAWSLASFFLFIHSGPTFRGGVCDRSGGLGRVGGEGRGQRAGTETALGVTETPGSRE